MKKLFFIIFISCFFISCNNNSQIKINSKIDRLQSEGWKVLAIAHSDSTTLVVTMDNSLTLLAKYLLENNEFQQYLILTDYSFTKIQKANIICVNVIEKSILDVTVDSLNVKENL